MAFSLSLIGGVGYFVFFVHTRPFFVNYRQLSRKEVVLGFSSVSCVLLVFSGGLALVVSSLIAGVLIFAHAAMRQRSLKAKSTNFVNSLKSSLTSSTKHEEDEHVDVENPKSDLAMSDLNSNSGGINAAQQQEFRNTFRASMRNVS